jgi:hypothetical protein
MDIDPYVPCNFSLNKLSFYVPSDFSIPVLERYGPSTRTIVFGVIAPNARFHVTKQVIATLITHAYLLPNLECIFSYSGNVASDLGDDEIISLVRTFRDLKSIYLEGYKSLTDRTFIAILYACPGIEEIIISAGAGNEGFITQKSLGAFFNKPRVGDHLVRVELLHQAPTAFMDDIILPLIYDFASRGRQFKFWKTAPRSWESWMLPEPGEVDRDEVQRKIAFGSEWFKKKNTKEQLKVIERWQSWTEQRKPMELESLRTPVKGKEGQGSKGGNSWKGSIRKRMLGGLL